MRRVISNGQSYAVGLDWFPLQRMTRAEVIQEAERYDDKSDLVVILKEQYALARSGNRTWKKKLRSLAATLIQAKYPDAIYIFNLVDADTAQSFWWVVGIRKGIISNLTDRCFDDQDGAQALSVSVRDSFGVADITEVESLDSLTRTHKFSDPTVLTPLKETAAVKLMKTALIVAGFGLGWWMVDSILDYRAAQEALEQARILTQNKEKRAKELAEHPEKYFLSDWMNAPLASVFMDQCTPEMFRFPTAANGWHLVGLSCLGNSMSATWEQTALSDYMHLPFNAVIDAKKPRIVVSGKQLPTLHNAGRNLSSLLSQSEASRYLYAVTQRFRLNLKQLSFDKRQTKLVEKIQLSCPWIKARFELANVPAFLVTDYHNFGKALSEIPGLIITEISYAKENWTIRGELYAK